MRSKKGQKMKPMILRYKIRLPILLKHSKKGIMTYCFLLNTEIPTTWFPRTAITTQLIYLTCMDQCLFKTHQKKVKNKLMLILQKSVSKMVVIVHFLKVFEFCFYEKSSLLFCCRNKADIISSKTWLWKGHHDTVASNTIFLQFCLI